jgi:Asp-tRNA(Asn)/Glu-tRNA(Gln) amidotransferase A subunit family amidase
MAASIEDQARAVRAGEVTAVALARRALERSERSQAEINAYTSLDPDNALEAAARVDSTAARGHDPAPLAGVPVAVKDLIDHAGRANTCGGSFEPLLPVETAPSISRLEAAGAVVVGRAGLHEFAFGLSSENDWFGPVRNPWDTSLSPGGSSGGSAAAVAAGLVPASLGTDTGGSVRVPAALCGIVGLKVTHGRVPLRGVYPLASSLDTVGPLARTVADAAAVYAVIAGDDPADPWSVPRPVQAPGGPPDLADLTIGVPRPWTDRPVTAEVRNAFDRWLDGLSDAGARVVDVQAPTLGPAAETLPGLYFEVAAVHRERFSTHPEKYGPDVAERLADAMEVSGTDYLSARNWRRALRSAFARAFATVDLLATPTVAAVRKTIGVSKIEIGGKPVPYRPALLTFSTLANHSGLPAIALPLPDPSRPPPSVQLIAPAWYEARLLEAGLALESAGLVATRKPPHWRPDGIATNPAREA